METTVTICGLQKLLELERGPLTPTELHRGSHPQSEAGAGTVSLGKAHLLYLASWRVMQRPFVLNICVHIIQLRPRKIKSELLTCLFSHHISTGLSLSSQALNEIPGWNKEYKEGEENSFLPATPLCHENRPLLLCQWTCCSVPIWSQLSSLGTWESISVPLSWDLSPKLPVYPRINVNIGL